ncbi:MogA/MoaB family molybdenum cofactor biosynthesis protein [Leucobacter denitrificans]|uniref:MogA/MoaB family molybdenum cofactor biosynthesis protein n=1 Tax=Leucobacter denitrificans TaxID=683042 RepID=A0A7G9S433_9MICO|nr:MogA/MoaB family molybdenum cofactor biosynthesis protein [Leucobacter denitrificans]QNN62608.1 MogA/MoaB family molybdenum cofactor biosynthesis protein [Leucobacter denitrificans]
MNPGAARSAAVIVVSTSAASGAAVDETGPVIRAWLQARGFETAEAVVVADGEAVGAALRAQVDQGHRVVLTTGGTGIARDDSTPEETRPLLDVELPGLVNLLRERGQENTKYAALTRGVAGFADGTFVMNLPGSRGGVADGLAILGDLLDHLLEQREASAGHPPRRST